MCLSPLSTIMELPRRKPAGRYPGLRSLNSDLFAFHVKAHFYNFTERKVDVLWASYNGDYVLYRTLRPQERYEIHTFVGHPWIFEDADNRDPLIVKGKEIWWPPPVEERIVRIVLPLLSLETLAARAVRDCLTNPEDSFQLDLPKALQKRITVLSKTVYHHRSRKNMDWALEPTTQEATTDKEERIFLVALRLHEALSEDGVNISMSSLACIQVFLQWSQDQVDHYHATLQALLMVYQTFLDEDLGWIEVDPVLLSHAEVIVQRLLNLVDKYSTVRTATDIINFINQIVEYISTKQSVENNLV